MSSAQADISIRRTFGIQSKSNSIQRNNSRARAMPSILHHCTLSLSDALPCTWKSSSRPHAKDPTGRLTTLRGLIRRDHLEIFSAGSTPSWRPVGVSKMTRVRRSHSNRSDNIDTPVAHNLSCPRQPTESGIIYVYVYNTLPHTEALRN